MLFQIKIRVETQKHLRHARFYVESPDHNIQNHIDYAINNAPRLLDIPVIIGTDRVELEAVDKLSDSFIILQ